MNKIILLTLSENLLFKWVIINHTGISDIYQALEKIKADNETIFIKSIFLSVQSSVFNCEKIEKRIKIDNGLSNIRLLLKHGISIEFVDSETIKEELNLIKSCSPPLYEKLKLLTI